MSKEVRDFCGFTKVPDASKFTHFKQDFILDLQKMFDELVDITEPICQKIDFEKAAMTIFDTSGVEAFVAENNPKYSNKVIKQIKAYKKINNLPDSFNPYSVAYGSMPKSAASNSAIKLMYINGHFCYSYKFGIVTNGLGIVRNLSLYNKDFISSHPEITDVQTSNSPDNDKSLHDTKVLIPVLKDLFNKHPLIRPKTFLGDAAFDSCLIYDSLLTDLKFSEVYIPLNKRSQVKNKDYTINEDGIPCCPNNSSLPLKYEGASKRPNGLIRYKFVCPKVKWRKDSSGKYKRKCFCENPCTSSSCGRMIHLYPQKNLRTYPGTLRGTEHWDKTYGTRIVVEKTINHFKDSFCVANRKTQNQKTIHSDLLLAGITQLLTVILADKIHKHQYIRSLKSLVA